MRQPKRIFSHLSFLLFLTTASLHAQLRPDPPVMTFLADQLTDFGIAYGIPNGDFGPSRNAFTRHQQLWEPSHVAASWRGGSPDHTGIGNFTPHGLTQTYSYHPVRVAFAGSDRQQALYLIGQAGNRPDISGNFSFINDERSVDKNEDGRNDGITQRTLNGAVRGEWGNYEYRGGISAGLFDHQGERNDRLSSDLRRYSLVQYNNFQGSYVNYFSHLNLISESADRVFSGSNKDIQRRTGSLEIGARNSYGNSAIRWEANVNLLHREDEIRIPGIERNDREQFAALNGEFSYDLPPFRFRYNQQLRTSRMDSLVYRPHAEILWFSNGADDVHVAAIFNRGGGYRNPLLGDTHLAFSARAYNLSSLKSEDFWRSGITGRADILEGRLKIDVQAFHFNYRRYTAVRYTPDNRINVDQTGGTTRRVAAGQIGYDLSFIRIHQQSPTLYLNYRYDELRLADDSGVLLPALHAGWARLEIPVRFEHGRDDWKSHVSLSYLRQSRVEGLAPEENRQTGRSRLDASLRVNMKQYWVALRGEQLLRRESLTAYGFDPLAPGEDLPLGNEFSTLQGRRLTVAAGVGIGRR